MLFVDVDNFNITELHVSPNVTIAIVNVTHEQDVTIIAQNTFMNYTFSIDIRFIPSFEKREFIWIIILVLGVLMIIGLIIVWARQGKTPTDEAIK